MIAESTEEEEFLRPDVEGLVVNWEDAEDGLLQRPLWSIVVYYEFVVFQEIRQWIVTDELMLAVLAWSFYFVLLFFFADQSNKELAFVFGER